MHNFYWYLVDTNRKDNYDWKLFDYLLYAPDYII